MAKNQTKPDIGNLIKPEIIPASGRDLESGLPLRRPPAPMGPEVGRRCPEYYATSHIILENRPFLPSHPVGRDRGQASHLPYLSTQYIEELNNTPRLTGSIGAGPSEGGTMLDFFVACLFGTTTGADAVVLTAWFHEVLRTPLQERRGSC